MKHVFAIVVLVAGYAANGQFNINYTPRNSYSNSDKELVSFIRNQLKNDFPDINELENKGLVKQLSAERSNLLIRLIKTKYFILDDSLESYVDEVMQNLVRNNSVGHHSRQVLLARNPSVNASCFGNGIYVITIGLLGRITTEDQLAFTLAHEMAHDELGHVKSKIINEARIDSRKRSEEQVKKIVSGEIELRDIEEFRQLIYGLSRYNRQYEMEADSLAMILLANAGYDKRNAISMLNVLDNPMGLKYNIGAELFMPFHTPEYPFQIDWLSKRHAYDKTHKSDFMFSMDSLKSHPEIVLREEILHNMPLPQAIYGTNYQSWQLVNNVTTLAEFETVASAYTFRQYDVCLFYALQLLSQHPNNIYLITTIGRVLVELYEALYNYTDIGKLVSIYTADYSEELRLVNNFVLNLSLKELGEITFHFLHNKKYFNESDRNHYYLLNRISELTFRYDVARDLKNKFRERFNQHLADYMFKL